MEAEKFDITIIYPKLYQAESKKPCLVQVPVLRTLAIAGEGNPDAPEFQKAVEALYSTVYGLKFMPQRGPVPEHFVDFSIPPLEALWSMKDGKDFDMDKPKEWQWDVFLVVPGFVTQALVSHAADVMSVKHPNPLYERLSVKTLEERQAVQILHTGSYRNETADIALMHGYMTNHELKPTGRHHEIYLSDPKRVAVGKRKTILRLPVVKQ